MAPKPAPAPVNVPASESQGARLPRDQNVWLQLESLLQAHQYSFQHVLELFPACVRRLHLGRFLAPYELFKQIVDLPECIVELGVYRGVSFFTWAKLMETFCPGDRKRKVFGFDNFAGFQEFHEKDGKSDVDYSKVISGYSPAAVLEEVRELVRITNGNTFVPESEKGAG